jgi:(1->4)-alpha-D-glucan 1-alpha-D-glucosylmutase
VAYDKKHLVMREILGSDVNRLTALFVEICERNRRHRDYTRHDLDEALREVIACFPVYRTYVRAEAGEVSEADARTISKTVEKAKGNRADLDGDLFDFFCDILLLRVRGELESEWSCAFNNSPSQ